MTSSLEWCGDALLFSAGSEVWALDSPTGVPQKGRPQKLVAGTAQLASVRGSLSRFVFVSSTNTVHPWALPLDLNAGKVRGQLQSLVHSGGSQYFPASSADGRVLAYVQMNPAGGELRLRDMNSGRESVLIAQSVRPKVSPDGSKVAYSLLPGFSLFVLDSSGGQPDQLLDSKVPAMIYGWTADGNYLVYWQGGEGKFRWYLYDLRARRPLDLISHPNINGAELSRDLKWVAFHLLSPLREPVKIAPIREGRASGEAEWITVAEYPGRNMRPWWSPDGNLLYFISQKDNYACIWAQRLDPATKHPVGEPFGVYHFHGTLHVPVAQLAAFGPAIAKDRIIFSLSEQTGNIWLAELEK